MVEWLEQSAHFAVVHLEDLGLMNSLSHTKRHRKVCYYYGAVWKNNLLFTDVFFWAYLLHFCPISDLFRKIRNKKLDSRNKNSAIGKKMQQVSLKIPTKKPNKLFKWHPIKCRLYKIVLQVNSEIYLADEFRNRASKITFKK